MKLTIVFTVLGQHEMATLAIDKARHLIRNPNTQIVVVDNGGDYEYPHDLKVRVVRPPDGNMGVYPVFKWAFDNTKGDVLAFLHSDLMLAEEGFDESILHNFQRYPQLGLIGFVGSNEIDAVGGRGSGTTSNFQGLSHRLEGYNFVWHGSPAEAHGKRSAGFTPAAVVDGCAMVIRRDAWDKIGFREDFPPHHFYDRLISTQMLEAGFEVGVLGIACDHISGQTVNKEGRYNNLAEEWSKENLNYLSWVGIPPNYSWDQTIYQQAERMWLKEYRDEKHIVPIRII